MAEQARKILALVDQDTGELEEVRRASYAFDGAQKPYLNRSWNVQVEQVSRRGDLLVVGA